ncbi:MAG: response regulator transcription factor [Caldimonas sp.]
MPDAVADDERAAEVVYVVDDDASVREALSSLLRATGLRVQTFTTAAEYLRQPRTDAPTCLVLDVVLPGGSGLELQQTLSERSDAPPIIFVTGCGDLPMGVKAMKAGAVEFLSKPFLEVDLLVAIDHALERDARAQQGRAEVFGILDHLATLTRREFEVMDLVVRGLLNKQIAAELGITEVTVKVHRRRVMEKMRVHSLPDLVRMRERVRSTLPEYVAAS